MWEIEPDYIMISHEKTNSTISGRFYVLPSLSCLLVFFMLGECSQSCLGNVQSRHTKMAMQQSIQAKRLEPAKSHQRKRKREKKKK